MELWTFVISPELYGCLDKHGRKDVHTSRKKACNPLRYQPTHSQKVGVEKIMAAFTDDLAACVRINLGDTRGHIVDKAYENLTVKC